MHETKLLIIDDEKTVIDTIQKYFSSITGYALFSITGFTVKEELFAYLRKIQPELIILDLIMPGINGLDICKFMKTDTNFKDIPVIMLSGSSSESDKVACLNAGADDYIVKPFSFIELTARINVQMRRRNSSVTKINIDNTIDIDLEKHTVTVDNRPIALTATEFTILTVLASNKGKVLSRDQIMDRLTSGGSGERTIDVHIRHLREKLGAAGKLIKNIRSFGYTIK